MARRQRDHKAEYRRRKARAQAAGYTGVAQYRRARKASGVTRTQPTPRFSDLPSAVARQVIGTSRAKRRAAKAWSDAHSRVESSQYKSSMSDEDLENYYDAYVKGYVSGAIDKDIQKVLAVRKYTVASGYYTKEEAEERYPLPGEKA